MQCSCLEKSGLITDSIYCWQMIHIIKYGQQESLLFVITHHIQPIHKCCHVCLMLALLMPFWIAIQRSIHCLLRTTGHNKWIILFTIKAPVLQMNSTNCANSFFMINSKMRSRKFIIQGEEIGISHIGSKLFRLYRVTGLQGITVNKMFTVEFWRCDLWNASVLSYSEKHFIGTKN